MAPTIDRVLPEELLDHIISYCRDDAVQDRTTLMNLSLASKTFNRIANRYLYSKIYLKESDHLPALAYLFFTSPTHAALVRTLLVPESWGKEPEDPSTFIPRSWPKHDERELSSVLAAKCAQLTSNDEETSEVYEKIASGANEDAILALLLATLPNLQRVNINFGIFNKHEDFSRLITIITNAIRKFGKMTNIGDDGVFAEEKRGGSSVGFSSPIDVMVTGTDDKYPNPTDPVATMLNLPNLRSLYAWKAGDGDGGPGTAGDIFAQLKPKSCSVEYVELRDSKLHIDNFNNLLQATIPGKLKTINYEVGCTWAWCNVHHSKMMTSLLLHHSTLESLGLSHEDFYPYQFSNYTEDNGDQPTPCSFVDFTALKHLKVAPVFIWGHHNFTSEGKVKDPQVKEMLWKALPKNLEQLWVTRAEQQETSDHTTVMDFVPECLLPALLLVVEKKSEAFPKLCNIRIELPLLKWEDGWFDSLEHFCETAAANGIQCTIILAEMTDHYSQHNVERSWGWDEEVEWEVFDWSHNQECAKLWLKAEEYNDLAQMLRDIKARFEEIMQKYESSDVHKSQRVKRSDIEWLAQWLEHRTNTKNFWRMCTGGPVVLPRASL